MDLTPEEETELFALMDANANVGRITPESARAFQAIADEDWNDDPEIIGVCEIDGETMYIYRTEINDRELAEINAYYDRLTAEMPDDCRAKQIQDAIDMMAAMEEIEGEIRYGLEVIQQARKMEKDHGIESLLDELDENGQFDDPNWDAMDADSSDDIIGDYGFDERDDDSTDDDDDEPISADAPAEKIININDYLPQNQPSYAIG